MNKLIACIFSLTAVTAQAQNTNNLTLALNQQQNNSTLENKTDSVSPQEAATLLSEKKAVIIDVRDEDEWNQQHIPGAIHIPLDQLLGRLQEIEQYKEKPIITQCQRGGRSQHALTLLKSLKFSKVYNLEGGIVAWDAAGLKID